jgi:hypothetical protein
MPPALRHAAGAAVQLVVTGPVAAFAPWAILIFLPMLPVNLFTGEGPEQLRGLAYSLGGAGLLGLYTAILVPTRALRRSGFVRGAVAGLIGLGVFATFLLLFLPEESGPLVTQLDAYRVWLFGGPLLTGTWILWQLLRPEPPEPPVATPPADR